MPSETLRPALFSAGHNFSQFMLTREQFESSLCYQLLLQPRVAIPDTALVSGDYGADFVLRYPEGESWIERGIKDRFILPYLRCGTWKDSVDELLEPGVHRNVPTNPTYLSRLDAEKGDSQNWPEKSQYHLAANFGERLNRILQLELPVDSDPGLVRFWEGTRPFREVILEKAPGREGDGILLSVVTNVLAEHLLSESERESVRGPRDLLDHVGNHHLESLLTLLCHEYERNMASGFGCDVHLRGYSRLLATLDSLQAAEEQAQEIDSDPADAHFHAHVPLPVPDVLRKLDGSDLAAMREEGWRYFASVQSLTPESGTDDARECMDHLERYTRRICEIAKGRMETHEIWYQRVHWGLGWIANMTFSSLPTIMSRELASSIGVGARVLQFAVARVRPSNKREHVVVAGQERVVFVNEVTKLSPFEA